MISFRFKIRHVEYRELETIYRYVQRSTVPAYLGKSYGVIYESLLGMPDLKEHMERELDEASRYLAARLSEVREECQKHFFNLLKRKPPHFSDIYFMNYYTSSTEVYTKMQLDVDYHDETHQTIEITAENIHDYFDVTDQFMQDKTNSYSDAESMEYTIIDDDYYYGINPFTGVEKYDELTPDTMSCRNFTFQVTEDCNLRCFAPGTKVIMGDYTTKNIEEIKEGDTVVGFTKKNHEDIKIGTVTHVFEVRKTRVIELFHPMFGSILVTPDHEFITADNRWIRAIDIKETDILPYMEIIEDEKSYRPDLIYITNIKVNKKKIFEDEIPVYNIETTLGTYTANGMYASNCSYCILPGTLITMNDHTVKPIEEIKEGDILLGFDEDVKDVRQIKLGPTIVTNTIQRTAPIVTIHTGVGDNFTVTYDHPMLTMRGWISAGELKIGDRLVRLMGMNETTPLFYYPEVVKLTDAGSSPVYNLSTSLRTFIADRYLVHNCYQTNKNASIMDLETAKSAVDDLLAGRFAYLSPGFSKSIILEFIGGDPLLEIELIEEIYRYFLQEAYRLNHPWFHHHRMSICSNGLLYFNDATLKFFDRYSKQISFNVSIDGNKSLHDSCRVQPTGEGSYDVGIAAVHHSNRKYMIDISSKMTLAPSNIPMIMESVKNLCIDNNYPGINLNCVFENVWNVDDAKELYRQMKGITDLVIQYDRPDLYFSIFRIPPIITEYDLSEDMNNVCFKAGSQVMTPNGSKNIESLKEEDLVYTASGSLAEVTKTHSRYSENNVRVCANGILPVECTYDHPVVGMKNGKKGFYPIGEMNVGDMIGLSVMNFIESNVELPTDLAYLIGAYCIAGSCVHNIEQRSDYIILSMEDDVANFCYKKINIAGLTYFDQTCSESEMKQYIFRSGDSQLNRIFVGICASIKHGREMRIPEAVWSFNHKTICAFLRGCVDLSNMMDRGTTPNTIRTTSIHMASDLLYLLRSLGYFPTVKNICTIENDQQYQLYEVHLGTESNNFYRDNEYPIIWTPITEIKQTEPFEVYNVTVEGPATDINPTGEHTMICQGIAVKQCGGGNASMLALDPKGLYYPCIRYMESSLNNEAVPLVIGDIHNKMNMESHIIRESAMMTYITQQNDRCLSCPLVRMCTWCSALCFQNNGTINERTTHICDMVKAEYLGSIYYWGKMKQKYPQLDIRLDEKLTDFYIFEEIIDREEYNMLDSLLIKK